MTAPPAPYEKPRSSGSRTFLIVLAVLGGIGAVGALTCAGLAVFGVGLLESQVQAEVEDALEPHVGTIRAFDLNWTATGLHQEPNVLVYDVEGSTGAGRLVADHTTVNGNREEVRWAVLHPDGRADPIVVAGTPPSKFIAGR